MNISDIVFTCTRCDSHFYSNNKLHRHLRECQRKSKMISEINHIEIIKVSIVESTVSMFMKSKEEFVFRSHRYVTILTSIVVFDTSDSLCADFEISMSLIDRSYLNKKLSKIKIQKIATSVTVRDIEKQVHDSSKYVMIDLYISERIIDESVLAHLASEIHIVNNLKANVLIDMNIMSLEQIILDFDKNMLIVSICKSLSALIFIISKDIRVNRTVRAIAKTIVVFETCMTVSVRVRRSDLSSDRDYSFHSKSKRQLRSEDEYFAHVIDSEICAIQMRNTTSRSFIISKNDKVNELKDFEKNEAYLTMSENRHLTIRSFVD